MQSMLVKCRMLSDVFIALAGVSMECTVLAQGGAPMAVAAPVRAEEVLCQALEARGGREAFLKIQSFHAEGSVSFFTASGPWGDAPAITYVWPLEVFAMRPNKFRFATDLSSTAGASFVFVPPRYYENGFDGQNVWEAPVGNPPQVLEGILGEERREQAQFFAWCAEPQNYRSVTNLGEVDFQGQRCYELKLVRKSGNEETHFYGLTNHFLAGIVQSSAFGPSLERFVFDNYREFGGFQFPTRIEYFAIDERPVRAVEQLEFVDVNGVKDSDFEMPRETLRLDTLGEARAAKASPLDTGNMLQDWIDTDKLGEGAVVGLLDGQERWVAYHGRCSPWRDGLGQGATAAAMGLSLAQAPKVNDDMVFPLASISKVFTRLLLLDMVQRGEMRLDDPVQKYLPASVHMPMRNGKQITLLHLATHTSGLPRYIPGSEKRVYAWLSDHKLARDPGAGYEYSNTGMGLLGKAIERKAGKSYRRLVMERICQPLGMNHTSVMNARFPGVDGVISSANDLLTFGSACLGVKPVPPPLGALMRHEYATHGGGFDRFELNLVLDHAHHRALVTLWSKTEGPYSEVPQSLNRLILNQSFKPLASVSCSLSDDYSGQYLLDNNSVWSVRRNRNRLVLQEVCRESYELFPTSETEFTNCLVGLGAIFVPRTAGKPPRLVLHDPRQNTNSGGSRISAQAPLRGTIVKLAPEIAGNYVGQYKDSEGNVLTIRRSGSQFTLYDVSGLNVQSVVPESEISFISPISLNPAWTFLRDNRGQVTGLIRHNLSSHARYDKVANMAPVIADADADRFQGTWETAVVMDEKPASKATKQAIVKISKVNGSYRAAIDITKEGIEKHRFKTLVFLSKSALFLETSFGKQRVTLGMTLNEATSAISGTWKLGRRSLPVTFKRNAENPVVGGNIK